MLQRRPRSLADLQLRNEDAVVVGRVVLWLEHRNEVALVGQAVMLEEVVHVVEAEAVAELEAGLGVAFLRDDRAVRDRVGPEHDVRGGFLDCALANLALTTARSRCFSVARYVQSMSLKWHRMHDLEFDSVMH